MEIQSCYTCNQKFSYDEQSDQENNHLVPKKIRKVVVDENKIVVPLYEIPPDKRRIIGKKFIKFMCNECLKRRI